MERMDSLSEIVNLLNRGGLIALLVMIIATGIKALWVPGFAYREKKAERDQAVATLEKFIDIHEAQTRALEAQAARLVALEAAVERLSERLERRSRA